MIEISEKPASIVALVIGLSCLLEYSLYKLLLAQTIQLIDAYPMKVSTNQRHPKQ
jgi:hypothetical protein